MGDQNILKQPPAVSLAQPLIDPTIFTLPGTLPEWFVSVHLKKD